VVALIHAVHPLHVESVAWVSSRKDVLSLLMMLIACLAYAGYAKSRIKWFLLGSLAFCVLALLSKPSAVVLAPIILALDFALIREGSFKSRLARSSCHFGLCIALAVGTFLIHQASGNAELIVHVHWYEKIGLVCWNYVHYVGQFFFPRDLSFFYRYPDSLDAFWLIGSTLLMTLTVIFLAQRFYVGKLKTWHASLILFLVSYVPMCGLVVVSDALRADRYMYLPYIFLSMCLCDLGARACGLMSKYVSHKQIAIYGSILVSLWLVLMSVLAFQYTGHWKNNESLYQHALRLDQKNYLAWHNLGTSSLTQGEFVQAGEQFHKVLALKPTYKNAHLGVAEALSAEGSFDEAEGFYLREIALHPNEESHLAYAHFLFDRGQHQRCISFVANLSVDSKPFDILLAFCHHGMKNYVEASNYYQQALDADQSTDELLINYALCLTRQEKFGDAGSILNKIKDRTDPRYQKLEAYLSSK